MQLKWTNVNEQEPEMEVLAIGYQKEMAVGYVSQSDGMFVCELEGSTLTQVTHWIALSDLRTLHTLQTL